MAKNTLLAGMLLVAGAGAVNAQEGAGEEASSSTEEAIVLTVCNIQRLIDNAEGVRSQNPEEFDDVFGDVSAFKSMLEKVLVGAPICDQESTDEVAFQIPIE